MFRDLRTTCMNANEGGVATSTSTSETAPELSVVMPSKNVGPWIAEAVHSVLTQTVSDLELIVVDDGSEDDTLDVLATIDDHRLTVVSNPGSGGGTARNHGASLARGSFLAFADGDDLVPERAYETLLGQARRTGAEMVVGNYTIFSPTTINHRHQWFPHYGRTREGVTIWHEPVLLRDRVCWNRVFDREAWDAAGIRFADAPRSNDIQAMTDAYCAFTFDVIPDIVYMYRRRAGASSMTAKKTAPDSIVAHFTQELGCLASVERLQSPKVFDTYAGEMLDNDVWAHVGPLLDPANVGDPAYDEARRVAVRFISRTFDRGAGALSPVRRAIYALAIGGDWATASAIGSAERAAAGDVRHDPADVAAALRRAGFRRGDAAAQALRMALIAPLRTPAAIADDALADAVRRARRFALQHVPVWRLNRDDRHVLAADPSASPDAIRAHLERTPPEPSAPVRAARHVLHDAKRAADAGSRASRRAGGQAVDAARGAARRLPFPVRRAARTVIDRARGRG